MRTLQGSTPFSPICSLILVRSEPPTMPIVTFCTNNVGLQQIAMQVLHLLRYSCKQVLVRLPAHTP